jgi:hypothetical protein
MFEFLGKFFKSLWEAIKSVFTQRVMERVVAGLILGIAFTALGIVHV